MNQGTGSATAPIAVLAEILARLAAITPEQIVPPPQDREEGCHVVVTANDDLKRLFTLRNLLADEHNELVARYRAMDEAGSKDRGEFERLEEQIVAMKILHQIVDQIFWLDARRQHPSFANKRGLGITHDWSLCWRDDVAEEDAVVRIGVLSIRREDLAGLTELAEIFGERRGPLN